MENVLGITEFGEPIEFDPLSPRHTLITGQTGSGKSNTTYGALMHIARTPGAQACVIDPQAVLSAPWAASASGNVPQHVSGVSEANLGQVLGVLRSLVAEMDARTAVLGRLDRDKVPNEWFGPDFPAIWLVLEEYAGLMSIAESVRSRPPKPDSQLRALVGRLLREGRKAGISVMTVLQRPEAAVVHDRGQYSQLILHLLENRTSIDMVLPDADDETVNLLTTLSPGEMGYRIIGPKPLVRAKALRTEFEDYARYVRQQVARQSGVIHPDLYQEVEL